MSTISKDYLKSLMKKDNISLEELLDSITSAANEIEAESKFDKYSAPLRIEGNDFLTRIATSNKLSLDDFVTIRLHFLGQNTPGYLSATFDSEDEAKKKIKKSIEFEVNSLNKLVKNPEEAVSSLIDEFCNLLTPA